MKSGKIQSKLRKPQASVCEAKEIEKTFLFQKSYLRISGNQETIYFI
ncbi:hypothetical protein SRB521_02434 [Intestinimonas butyriciproducens]|nr:hypothetical protein SRB521_02434 [Intestinimonas butyriciproducens]